MQRRQVTAPCTNEALTPQTSSRRGCKATQLQHCANAVEGRAAATETLTVTLATVTGWAVGSSYPCRRKQLYGDNKAWLGLRGAPVT